MHWTPPRPPAPKTSPEPGEWATVTGYCGCGLETGRRTFQWPPEPRTVFIATNCPYHTHGPLSGALTPSISLRWTRWGPAVSLRPRVYERPHP